MLSKACSTKTTLGLKCTKVVYHQPTRAHGVTAVRSNLRHRLHATTLGGETSAKEAELVEQLGTVISSDKKANWLAPKGDPKAARGVVLFMHGFAQGPNAYYKMLKELADAGYLVVAPEPPFAPTPGKQQEDMVAFAEHFRTKLFSNSLTGLELKSKEVGQNISLLAHSVGAGLATYVAYVAADNNQPFNKVMYMAPQTEVVKQFLPKTAAIAKWPTNQKGATEFALQYGDLDELAPPKLAKELIQDLRAGGLSIPEKNITVFDKGTHVGFEDQVVLGDQEVTSDVLPWLTPILIALAGIGIPIYRFLIRKDEVEGPAKAAAAAPAARRMAAPADAPGEAVAVPSPIAGGAVLGDLLLIDAAGKKAKQQPAEEWKARGAALKRAWQATPDGVTDPEPVKFITSPEEYVELYVKLLVGVVGLGAVLSVPGVVAGFQDGDVHWLSWVGLVLTVYLGYKGVTQLNLLSYVQNIQRPQSRDVAKAFVTSK